VIAYKKLDFQFISEMQHTCDPGEHFMSSNRNYVLGNQQSNLFLQIIYQEKIVFF